MRIYFPTSDLEEVLAIQLNENCNERKWESSTPINEENIDNYRVIDIEDLSEGKYDIRVFTSRKKKERQHQHYYLYEAVNENVFGENSI